MSFINVLSMLGGFVAGVAFAVGHHFFYLSHDGSPVGTEQEWTLRIGAGFAFLVRFFYSFSLGIALVQIFWGRFQGIFGTKMGTVDKAFEIRTSPAALFDLSFWAFSPMMVFHGIVYWLLPLAIAVAPPSLTIVLRIDSSEPVLVYEYHRRNLFIAYLIPGVLVFIGCIFGVINIISSTRSYSSTLSTVIRTSRNESLDQLIQVTDRNGGDPLPQRLARTKIRLAVLYGTSVALDGENYGIEVVESGSRIDEGTRHATRGGGGRGQEREERLVAQRIEDRDSELEDLSTAESQDHPLRSANAKDRPVFPEERR